MRVCANVYVRVRVCLHTAVEARVQELFAESLKLSPCKQGDMLQ
jgi:hypothetical protein